MVKDLQSAMRIDGCFSTNFLSIVRMKFCFPIIQSFLTGLCVPEISFACARLSASPAFIRSASSGLKCSKDDMLIGSADFNPAALKSSLVKTGGRYGLFVCGHTGAEGCQAEGIN